MKIVDYVVVWASSEVSNLERVVWSAIKDWRQPLWWLSTHSVEGGYWITTTYYYQAMVKYVVLIDKRPRRKKLLWIYN